MKGGLAMKKFASVALVVVAIVLTMAGSSQAAPHGGHDFHAAPAPRAHFEGHRAFEGPRHFEHHGRGGAVFVAPSFVWGYPDYPPAYAYTSPAYWYYCPTYGAYYPNVNSCPVPWVTVPAG
jgi:hypothetical protein